MTAETVRSEQAHSFSESENAKIDLLLSKLTLEEKVGLLSGKDFWSLKPVERLGIPSLCVSDGPTGLRSINSDPATVFPVGVALASSWDRSLVCEMSAAIGREAIAHGVDVLLAPGLNIQRTPLGGRNFEYYSEDPHLSSEIGIAYVEGVQSEGVGTSVKHYVANNQEHMRMQGSSNVTTRVLNEVYLASFEPVIKEAGPWTVMSAYNRVNGTFASEHDALLNGVLKTEWGFDGVVVSDWAAAKSTVASANGGLDLEMPGPGAFYGEALLTAVEAGQVTEATVDDHARRVLGLIVRCGLLDGDPKSSRAELCTPKHRQLARQAAANSMVLLKNDTALLPLDTTRSIAVIGGLADHPAIQGGGSSQVSPDRIVTPLEGLREALGGEAALTFERGIDHEPSPPILDGRLLSPEAGSPQKGLSVRYFDNPDFKGEPVHRGIEWHFAKLGFGAAAQTDNDLSFSAEWTGFITPRYSGVHDLLITHSNPDVEVILDDETLVGDGTDRKSELLFMILPMNRRTANVRLEAGRSYPITVRYRQTNEMSIRAFNIFNIFMREPAPERDAAINAAVKAEQAIVFAGTGTTAETEGKDRASMRLSDKQNQLIEDVLAANPNTIVVLNTGGPVEMPWADRVRAIVQMWLPGQEGGHALSDILMGKTNPSGKLPVTFPKRYEDNPTYLHYPGNLHVDYGEGLFVGYKHYDAMELEPLFPFGHGLSYSRFELSNARRMSGSKLDEMVSVSVDLKNVGDLQGAETLQVYVEDTVTTETMPRRQLRAFEKVCLAAGEARTVRFDLPPRAFSWFDPDTGSWQKTPGLHRVHIGTSSRDLPISMDVIL